MNTSKKRILNPKNCFFGFIFILIFFQKGNAQFSNQGHTAVVNGTILSVYEDYINMPLGNFINDGQVYIFKDWKNDGKVGFTSSNLNGCTYFQGALEQFIEGSEQSDFQNVVFNNTAVYSPFNLGTVISVNNKAKFENGIVNADGFHGLMIFNENAIHQNVRDESFVDGEVQKKGNANFEFPVGSGIYFRPSYHTVGSSLQNVYTTQYFHKNSNDLFSHSQKDNIIESINNKEYWKVTRDSGSEKIVLNLTLDNRTTPASFFNAGTDFEVVITRWDQTAGKWINEGGVTSDPLAGKVYEKLVTAQVSGYGIFTTALIKKTNPEPEEVVIYNAISPNDDGINDSFLIEGIDKYPDNKVEIYNRWGVKVYDANSYNESDVMFRGYSDGRVTIKRGDKLPAGTYFYILKYNNGKKEIEKAGYLYINNH